MEEKSIFCTEVSMKLLPEAYAPQELVIKLASRREDVSSNAVLASRGRIISVGTL